MNATVIPEGYRSRLSVYETQRAIVFIKQSFQQNLGAALNLKRVSAPLFVGADTGLNDNLNGVERPVSFDVPAAGGREFQVVHSLAKWKRWALKQYDFYPGNGLYTDMNAIRRDEAVLDNLHSVYVDQWDWEKVITAADRSLDYLRETVTRIVDAISMTSSALKWEFPAITNELPRGVYFVTSQELEDRYPELTPSQRENAVTREHGTTFVMQIGKTLRSGRKHDDRAPDYDDWELNGDILFYNEVLGRAFEISSMGIRVDAESLARQLKEAGCEERRELPFHKALLNGQLPLTIGGGIGQSRLCMLMLGCAHIGEVQSGVWDDETMKRCREAGIMLL
ncbi:MAG: aspartate--ammonia ligase [Clostridiales bacterium]|nr:aspartate--ammonia ligase [Clostridiales bacterium]MDY2835668.1 aspartate--ammonia ligase [Candidatus Aphodomonas sp.]